ncbi:MULTISPECIES: MBL fold metallo-hydrolase [Serratia]|uniref:MBL fold metallo-hydrolase n=1 Tax=Serratia TaxID=613 RepID=UPI000D731D7A|nr:MBL fold metallo-hydrolase [Serratia marcescens]AWO80503.1 hypothetical protein C1N78_18960 [Serratia marcescens]
MALKIKKTLFGDVEVIQIVELDISHFMPNLLPDATPERVKGIEWLCAPYRNNDYSLNAVSQCFIIRKGKRLFVVDTCVGNEKEIPGIPEFTDMNIDFIEALTAAGIATTAVTDVLCTHLHFDHVGWNTYRKDGQWYPTFPRAKYHFADEELSYWMSNAADESAAGLDVAHAVAHRQSVQPVLDAGLANRIAMEEDLGDGFSVFPSPGHSIAHVCLRVETDTGLLILAGDMMHHPCQIAHPEWASASDHDQNLSTATRHKIFGELSGTQTLIAGTHFPSPSFGRISQTQSGDFVFNAFTYREPD